MIKRDKSTGTARTPALTRKIETLIVFFLGITENSPKMVGIDKLLGKLFDELIECETASILAYSVLDSTDKIKLLQNLSERLIVIGSITKCIFEWSSQNKQGIHLMSENKHSEYLTLFCEIVTQNDRWIASIKNSSNNN